MYSLVVPVNIGVTGLTLNAALYHDGVVHPTFRDIPVPEILNAGGIYEFSSDIVPSGYRGVLAFYTGTVGVIDDFQDVGIVIQAVGSINPQQQENADVKTSSIIPTSGSGAFPITVTVTDGAAPIQGATVRVTEGLDSFTAITDVNGEATFSLDAATYLVSVTKAGYEFTPENRNVTGIQAGTLTDDIEMTATVIPSPSAPTLCSLFGTLYKPDGTFANNVPVKADLVVRRGGPAKAGGVVVGGTAEATTDASGFFELEIVRTDELTPSDCTYTISCAAANFKKEHIRVEASTLDLASLIT